MGIIKDYVVQQGKRKAFKTLQFNCETKILFTSINPFENIRNNADSKEQGKLKKTTKEIEKSGYGK